MVQFVKAQTAEKIPLLSGRLVLKNIVVHLGNKETVCSKSFQNLSFDSTYVSSTTGF